MGVLRYTSSLNLGHLVRKHGVVLFWAHEMSPNANASLRDVKRREMRGAHPSRSHALFRRAFLTRRARAAVPDTTPKLPLAA